MAIFSGSRYIKSSVYARRGQTFIFNIREKFKPNLKNITYYTVVSGDTIDGISYKHYGNAQLGWAIMDCNPEIQSELDLEAGIVLKIPPYEEVVKVCE